MVKKILLILVIVISLFGCEFIGGYKPLTLSEDDLKNMFSNPTSALSDSNLLEQIMVFDMLTKSGDSYLFACAADYDSKKHLISKQSPWGIYYKKIGKDDFDIIVDMEKFIEYFTNMLR